jgi:hypothetical protein
MDTEGSFLEFKRSEREPEHSPAASKTKNEWSKTSTPACLHDMNGGNFTVTTRFAVSRHARAAALQIQTFHIPTDHYLRDIIVLSNKV